MISTEKNNICLKCGKKLSGKKRKYCSSFCTQNSRPKKCPTCNKNFLAHQMKVYCTKKCKLTAFKINKHASWTKPSSPQEFKICSMCKLKKRFDKFREVKPPINGWRDIDGKPRLSRCRICEGNIQKEKRHKKPWWRLNIMAKGRAKKNNLAYNINEEDIKSIWPKDNKCPILGVEFKEGISERNNWPTLDKIIPKKGYIKGNIAVISFRANQMKSDVEDFEVFNKIYNFYKNK